MAKEQYHHGDLKNALIRSGTELLAEEGVTSLSLRQVAARAGVSHSAPYAHFADKQALIAAISTEGFRRLYDYMAEAAAEPDPARALEKAAWAYVQFALDNRACFQLMFSGILEDGQYPEFSAISHQSFRQIEELTRRCQAAGYLRPGPVDVAALSLWSQVHGFVCLYLEGQISHTILNRAPLRDLLRQTLRQITISTNPTE